MTPCHPFLVQLYVSFLLFVQTAKLKSFQQQKEEKGSHFNIKVYSGRFWKGECYMIKH